MPRLTPLRRFARWLWVTSISAGFLSTPWLVGVKADAADETPMLALAPTRYIELATDFYQAGRLTETQILDAWSIATSALEIAALNSPGGAATSKTVLAAQLKRLEEHAQRLAALADAGRLRSPDALLQTKAAIADVQARLAILSERKEERLAALRSQIDVETKRLEVVRNLYDQGSIALDELLRVNEAAELARQRLADAQGDTIAVRKAQEQILAARREIAKRALALSEAGAVGGESFVVAKASLDVAVAEARLTGDAGRRQAWMKAVDLASKYVDAVNAAVQGGRMTIGDSADAEFVRARVLEEQGIVNHRPIDVAQAWEAADRALALLAQTAEAHLQAGTVDQLVIHRINTQRLYARSTAALQP